MLKEKEEGEEEEKEEEKEEEVVDSKPTVVSLLPSWWMRKALSRTELEPFSIR